MTQAAMETTERLGPTMERLRHGRHMHIEAPFVDQRTERRTWRLVNVVEMMRRAGRIDERRWDAWERFEKDWDRAAISRSITAKYGERAGLGGTPVSQMTAEAIEMANAADVQRLDAIERVHGGLAAISVPRLQRAMVMVVSQECNLEQIGAVVTTQKSVKQREAIARAAIEDGLWLLHTFYQRLYGQASVAP